MKTELQGAMQMLHHLPTNQLIGSVGCWHFVGRVDARLGYVRKDGKPATQEDYENVARFGPNLAGMQTRIFATKEDAEAALAALD